MSRALPSHGVAWDSATSGALIVAGVDQRPGHEGNQFGAALVPGTAWGGTQSCDGISFCQSALYNCRSTIIEYLEMETPVVVWGSGIVMDSAGAGKFRGGFAPAFTIEAVTELWATPLFDSSRSGPKGLDGGGPGVTSHGMLVSKDEQGSVASWNGILPSERMEPLFGIFDDDQRPDPARGEYSNGTKFETSKVTAMTLAPGEVLRLHTACGGGYGDPLEREPSRVLTDLLDERISLAHAADVYGVVIDADTLAVDDDATASRREELAGRRDSGDWSPTSFFQAWPKTQADFEKLAGGTVGGGVRAAATV
jgi:N-methylhydantoinase B